MKNKFKKALIIGTLALSVFTMGGNAFANTNASVQDDVSFGSKMENFLSSKVFSFDGFSERDGITTFTTMDAEGQEIIFEMDGDGDFECDAIEIENGICLVEASPACEIIELGECSDCDLTDLVEITCDDGSCELTEIVELDPAEYSEIIEAFEVDGEKIVITKN